MPRRLLHHLPPLVLWLLLLICCGLPLAWLVVQLVIHPQVLRDAMPDSFRWWLIARTFGFNALAAVLATLIAIPVAIAVAAGRGAMSRLLALLVCVPLLMPSLVLTYGWKQAYALAGYDPMPQSTADVVRCIIALASWVWPVPAMVLAFALRRIDPNVLLQARLDGASGRIVSRLMAGPVVIGFLGAMLLALQEFAIFEPTGISVIATEVRAVFETGASLDQQWSLTSVDASQNSRMAASLAVMLPSLLLMIGVAIVVWWIVRSDDAADWNAAGEPSSLRHRGTITLVGFLVLLLAAGTPIVAMSVSLRTRFDPVRIVNEYSPQLIGSATLAIASAAIGILLLVIASAHRVSSRGTWLAIASFLIGGQWAAIALIVVFNRPGLWWVYDTSAMPIIAYVGRFAWIPLAAAVMTWSPGTQWLRDLAATDGAGRWAQWRHVILPLAWPLLAGAAVLMFTLSLTEVPATTLLQPAQTLVPMLMTWAHILNYDAMIEASLLLAILVLVAGVGVAGLVRTAGRLTK